MNLDLKQKKSNMEKCKDCVFLKKIPINSIINFLQCVNPNKNDCIKVCEDKIIEDKKI